MSNENEYGINRWALILVIIVIGILTYLSIKNGTPPMITTTFLP